MARSVIFIFLYAGLHLTAWSQSRGVKQDAKFETFRRTLLSAKGADRIDRLNSISMYYLRRESRLWDSALVYGQQAITESKKINYIQGLLVGYMRCGEYYLQLIQPEQGIGYYRKVLELAKKNGNDTIVGLAYRQIGQGLFYQGDFKGSIDNILVSIEYFEKTGLQQMIPHALSKISEFYKQKGDYEKAFEICQKAVEASRKINASEEIMSSLLQMGGLYKEVGDFKTALDYYRESAQYLKGDLYQWPVRFYCINMANIHKDQLQFDSAVYYYRRAGMAYPESVVVRLGIGEVYLMRGKIDSALSVLLPLYQTMKTKGEENSRMEVLLHLGTAYQKKKEYEKAIGFARNSLDLSMEKGSRRNTIAALKLVSELYQSLHLSDSALKYYQLYINGKDGLITDQFKGKLYEFRRITEDQRKLSEIELLKKEKMISQQELAIQQQQLRQNDFLRNLLIIAIGFISIIGFILFRNIILKRKNERLQNERMRSLLGKRTVELEMQALRAQMNPHFIFNCLTSINRFILKNETDIASDYLTRFSKLIRHVLTFSQSSLISLKEELDMLTLYLDMEQLRFGNAFRYTIRIDKEVNAESIYIPPLLFQPFCENAIWHGLMPKDGPGMLDVHISHKEGMLHCTISDNGIGRKKSEEYKRVTTENKKSFGLRITQERLALFNEEMGSGTAFRIEDLETVTGSTGTRVVLNIRFRESLKENAV